jgi:hypothetical protein
MRTKWNVIFFLVIAVGFFSMGQLVRADTQVDAGGGEIPTPFTALNRFFELADGETYVLEGQVVAGAALSPSIPFGEQQAWFMPDFNAQPWLASQKRLANPGYPMDNAPWLSWAPYAGQMLRIGVVAHGVVQNEQYVIFLEQSPTACEVEPATSAGHPKKHHL